MNQTVLNESVNNLLETYKMKFKVITEVKRRVDNGDLNLDNLSNDTFGEVVREIEDTINSDNFNPVEVSQEEIYNSIYELCDLMELN